jgi:hypothetical protein
MVAAAFIPRENGRRIAVSERPRSAEVAMKPWKAAAIAGVAWFVLTIVVCIVHTEFLEPDITPARDEALSYVYGQAAGLGVLPCAVLAYLNQKRRLGRLDPP